MQKEWRWPARYSGVRRLATFHVRCVSSHFPKHDIPLLHREAISCQTFSMYHIPVLSNDLCLIMNFSCICSISNLVSSHNSLSSSLSTSSLSGIFQLYWIIWAFIRYFNQNLFFKFLLQLSSFLEISPTDLPTIVLPKGDSSFYDVIFFHSIFQFNQEINGQRSFPWCFDCENHLVRSLLIPSQ